MGFNDIDIKVSGGSDIISTLQTYTTRILKPNIVDGKNILTQEMLSSKNTKYVIKYIYELLGATLTMPQNVILEFDGGSIKNGTLVGNETKIINVNDSRDIFTNISFKGTWFDISNVDKSKLAYLGEEDGEQQYIKDKDGNKILPITSQDAVRDINNTPLSTILTNMQEAIGTGGSVDSRISAAKAEIKGGATSACDTLGKAEALIVAEKTRAQNAESTLQNNIEALTQSNIVVVADHTSVTSPDPYTIYREQGTNSYSDWMYQNGSWEKLAEYNNAIDDEIKAGSKNIPESGAVAKSIQDTVDKYLPTKGWEQLTGVEKTDGNQWVSDGAGGITLSSQNNRTAVKFDAVAGQKYYVQGYNTGTSLSYAIYFLNSSDKVIADSTISSATPEIIEGNVRCVQFTTPVGCVSVAYTAYTNSQYKSDLQKKEINAPIEKQQAILNLTDVKYLNEAAKDSVYTTVNLYNSEDVNADKEINKYGELVVSQGKTVTNYIPIESVFTFTYITQGPPILCAFYDKDKRFISFLETSSAILIDNSYYNIYPPSGTKYVRIAYRESSTFKKLCPWFYPSVSLNYNQTYTRTIQEGLIPTSIQRVQDNSLNTENKNIPGAINEINNSYLKNTSKEAYLHEVKGEFLLDEDWFEKGNISFNSDSYVYGTNNNRIRTKRDVFIRLEKGDKICTKDKYISINCGYIDDDNNYYRITDRDSEGNIICKYSGNYMFVFLYIDNTPVGEVSDLLKKIYIVRKEQAVPSIVEYNQDEIEKLLALSCTSYPNTGVPSAKQKRRRFTSLIMTDVHSDVDRVKRFVQLYNTMVRYVDLGINLGDVPSTVWNAEGDNPTWYTELVAKCKNNIWGVIGNHEINGAESIGVERLTSQEAFEKFIAPLNLGLETSTPYYSKRFEDYGVTAIVLNCYDWPDDTYPYGTNTWIICQTQFDWLVNVLTNVPANDTVVIFMHAMGKTLVPDNSVFSSTMVNNNGNRILPADWYDAYFSTGLFGIIDAWQNHTSFSYNQTHEDISISINVDFTSRSEGKFAGFFVGHEHMDIVGHTKNYPNQNIFCLNSSSVDKALTGDLVRNLGQKNEDALTAFTIDTQGRKVHLLRFGANFTVNGELRSYASYTY